MLFDVNSEIVQLGSYVNVTICCALAAVSKILKPTERRQKIWIWMWSLKCHKQNFAISNAEIYMVYNQTKLEFCSVII